MERETFFKWKITCCLKSSAGTPSCAVCVSWWEGRDGVHVLQEAENGK